MDTDTNDAINDAINDINDGDGDDDDPCSWITNFLSTDKLYKDFYAEDLMFIKLQIIYLDINNHISNIKEEKVFMQKPNYLSREDVIRIIKTYCIYSIFLSTE